MVSRIDPLTWHTPIVDAKGKPSREFQLKWGQLAKAATTIPSLSTPAAVSAVLDVLSGGNVNGSILVRSGGLWQGYPSPSNAAKFLAGNNPPTWADVDDADLVLSDVLTNNVSTSKHGFAPKLPNDATKFLNGVGAYSTPAGGGGGAGDDFLAPRFLRPTVAGVTFNPSTIVGLPIYPQSNMTITGVKAYLTAIGSRNIYGALYSDNGLTLAGGTKLGQSVSGAAVVGLNTMPFGSPVALVANTWYWLCINVVAGAGNLQLMLTDITRNSYMFFTETTATAPTTAPASTAGTGGTQFSWWAY